MEQVDLFTTPELIPANIKAILDTFNEDAPNGYKELERLVKAIEKHGYTFDYYLDAEPYNLRKI